MDKKHKAQIYVHLTYKRLGLLSTEFGNGLWMWRWRSWQQRAGFLAFKVIIYFTSGVRFFHLFSCSCWAKYLRSPVQWCPCTRKAGWRALAFSLKKWKKKITRRIHLSSGIQGSTGNNFTKSLIERLKLAFRMCLVVLAKPILLLKASHDWVVQTKLMLPFFVAAVSLISSE